MCEGVDPDKVESLASLIAAQRGEQNNNALTHQILAQNDALQVYAIYAKRRKNREGSPANPFGYQTWWLTQDGAVRRAAVPVIAANGGHRFMMRPEFLLNFLSLAPSAAEISDSYRTVFPSVLGVRLSNRLADHTFKDVVRKANELWSIDEERAGAMISELTEKLKSDTLKVYDIRW